MKGFIYKITNKVNNKVYIGQTRYTVEFRWRQHCNKKDSSHFHNAISKYGKDNFLVETIEECPVESLNEREIYYIAKYDSFNKGYNSTIGGDGKRVIFSDNQYEEITSLYLSGFSSNKIATLFRVDKATIVKILKSLGVKIRSNKLNINNQEFLELNEDYESGYSLRELAKRYDCTPPALKEFLIRKGVDVRNKYNILKDEYAITSLINEYTSPKSKLSLKEILAKYKCSYNTFKKILSLRGVSSGRYLFKLSPEDCLELISDFNSGISVKALSKKYKVDKCTIYSILKRYNVNYLTV